MVQLTLRSPLTQCIKRRTNERMTLTIALRPGAHEQHDAFIVEMWSAVHNAHGDQPAAVKLTYLKQEGDDYLYSVRIPLRHSGYFPLQFRARHTAQQYWTWLEENGKKKTV